MAEWRDRFNGQARHFLADERGATAIEYALIAGGISIAIVTVVTDLGATVGALFSQVKDSF